MIDVNVLVYAHREEMEQHSLCKKWLEDALKHPTGIGLTDLVLSGFLRIVTHPRVFRIPTPFPIALHFVRVLREHPQTRIIQAGSRHWSIFTHLCEAAKCKGNTIPDAFLCALAIEQGCEWITTDRGFARFPGLHWSEPREGNPESDHGLHG